MESNIFRKKSLDKVKSPDQLNDYLKVPNPSTWLLIIAILIILIGGVFWSIFGSLESKVETCGVVNNNSLVIYVNEDSLKKVKTGQKVCIGDMEFSIDAKDQDPVRITEEFDEYGRHLGGFSVNEFVYVFRVNNCNLENGVYKTVVITEKINPIEFVFN